MLTELVQSGTRDLTTGIVLLPLIQALLTAGSHIPIGGEGSSITYVNLRKAALSSLMLPAPGQMQTSTSSPPNHGIFIPGGKRAGKVVGHFVALPLWNYINRPDISPDGWIKDFGTPITEALSFTITKDGQIHHLLVQAFLRDGLLLDQDTLDASGQPTIQRLTTGVDYLRTVGPPNVTVNSQQTIWAYGETDLLKISASEQAIAHIGQNFPLTLLGDTNWTQGMLWYHVQWSTPKNTSSGWVSAANVTFTSPGNKAAWASLNVLSPDLAAYLTGIGSKVGVVLYDVTHRRYYTYNSTTQFIVASSMKVPIMLTFLTMLEHQGREPNDDEMNLLTTMIENSNNDSASALYYSEIGSAGGVTNYMQSIGASGLNPSSDAWGYSVITPLAMVDLLTRLYEGKILTDHDRALALNLMEHVESDQQVGIGDTAPSGFTVAMKDGWVPGPDNLWAMNTSGIVMSNQQTYILSVYTQEQQSLEDGQTIVRQVCRTVASLLT